MNTEKVETRQGSCPDPTLAESPSTQTRSPGAPQSSAVVRSRRNRGRSLMPDSAPNPLLPGRPSALRPGPNGHRKGSPLLQGTPDGGTSKSYFLRLGAFALSPPGSVSCYLGPRRCFPFRNSPRSSSGVSSHPVPSRITPCVCVRLPFPNLDPQGSLGDPTWDARVVSRHAPQPAPGQGPSSPSAVTRADPTRRIRRVARPELGARAAGAGRGQPGDLLSQPALPDAGPGSSGHEERCDANLPS